MAEEQKKTQSSSDVITIKKDNLWKYSTFILLAIVVIGAIYIFNSNARPSTTGAVIGEQQPTPTPTPTPSNVKVTITKDDHIKGDANAPVKIVEYSDFECPFCGRWFTDTYGQINDKYIKDKKVAFIYRHFPLSFHPNAQPAAEASECASEQGKFWEMHDKLFTDGVQGGITAFKGYAQQLSLDTKKFNDCLDSGKYKNKVQEQFKLGQQQGIQGTPGFFVGNEKEGFTPISGAQPFQVFDQAIQSKL